MSFWQEEIKSQLIVWFEMCFIQKYQFSYFYYYRFFFIISVDNSNKTCIAVKWWYEYQDFINVKWNQRHDELTI